MASVKKNNNNQIIEPKFFGSWIQSLRKASGYSQETLAELSNCSVKTIQRVEGGNASSLDTRRCIAQGLGYDDMDFFENPENVSQLSNIFCTLTDKLNEQYRKDNFPDSIFIKAVQTTSGKELGTFAESLDGSWSDYDEKLPKPVIKVFCEILDYIREYNDTSEFYSAVQKLDVYNNLEKMLTGLRKNGYGIFYAAKQISLINNSTPDKETGNVTIGYMALFDINFKSIELVVPKQFKFN
jgi:transcriptional regulator with XRE-family HTH domain